MSLSMSEKWICFEFFRPSLASIQRRERERERERDGSPLFSSKKKTLGKKKKRKDGKCV
jgi:hypothetical protein